MSRYWVVDDRWRGGLALSCPPRAISGRARYLVPSASDHTPIATKMSTAPQRATVLHSPLHMRASMPWERGELDTSHIPGWCWLARAQVEPGIDALAPARACR
jgi:hypothetical protein